MLSLSLSLPPPPPLIHTLAHARALSLRALEGSRKTKRATDLKHAKQTAPPSDIRVAAAPVPFQSACGP